MKIGTIKRPNETQKKLRWGYRAAYDIKKHYPIYLMILPALVYFIIFHYFPMYGAQIAFRKYTIGDGIWTSEWVGLKNFTTFFKSYYFERLIRNTVLLNVYDILFGFPAPIIFALLIYELRNKVFKKTVQTITYIPHFISLIVICGMIIDFTSPQGMINKIIGFFGIGPIQFLAYPEYFRPIYVASNIWQETGWNSIIYLAALTNISPELYEAAKIDGAGRLRQAVSITLPGIAPTIIIMLILRMGRMMDVGYEKILLLYNPSIYETADVISTFVYRKGLLEANFSYSTAVEFFNSLINFVILVAVNKISRKVSETSLW
ncbi:MAG: sugar ABC transporter permease [Clostridiaceae bacterium]|nr:sugar ABC transporter permease [Clostridiaceae bacterium]